MPTPRGIQQLALQTLYLDRQFFHPILRLTQISAEVLTPNPCRCHGLMLRFQRGEYGFRVRLRMQAARLVAALVGVLATAGGGAVRATGRAGAGHGSRTAIIMMMAPTTSPTPSPM